MVASCASEEVRRGSGVGERSHRRVAGAFPFLSLSLFPLNTWIPLDRSARDWVIVLVLYVSSIVGGRLYTVIHGFLDVFIGIMLGITGLVLQRMVMPEVERWVTNSGWSGMSFMSCKTSSSSLRSCRSSTAYTCRNPSPLRVIIS